MTDLTIHCSGKPIYLPEVKKLSELFTEIVPYSEKTVGVFATSSGFSEYKSFRVTPTQKTNEITSKMINDFGIYFEFVLRNDNTLLVMAKYNSIIGSRWLTIIDDEKEIEKLLAI